jgi:hypothetical protein
MAISPRLRTIGRVTGVAAATAPKVRRLAKDDELRAEASDLVRSARDLVREVTSDERVRRDLRDIVSSALDGAGRVRQDVRPRHRLRRFFAFGAGLTLALVAIAAALAYPRSRQGIVRVAGETRQRATATVHDARERIGRGPSLERAA